MQNLKQPRTPAALLAVLLFFAAGPVIGADLKPLPGHVPSISKTLAPIGRLPATNELHLAIGLPLRDPAGLERFLAEVYDPASPSFRHFLTPEEFTARFSVTAADYAAVKIFAKANGFEITGEHANRLLLDVQARATDVERAFRIKLNKFKRPDEAGEFFAPDAEPTVEAGMPVADIQGLSDYGRPCPKVRKMDPGSVAPKNGSAPDGFSYMGDDFRNAYAPGVTLTGAGQSVGLLQFDAFYPADIQKYAKLAGGGRTNIPVVAIPVGVSSVTPGVNSGNDEVSMDIELVMAMAPGLANIYVFETSSTSYLNTMLSAMASSNSVKSFSCSWGWTGGPDATTDAIFQQMAAQGQSFFNASGDKCAFTVGANSVNGVDNTTLANAPSSCPYITQVGGTTLAMNGSGASYVSETAWNWGGGTGSSGGVSSYYTIPSWQTNISMANNQGSTAQRNIPDVAMAADDVYVISGGSGSGSGHGGTSCGAPLWAGFMALVNQQAAANGNPPGGFINPAIYAIGKGQNPNYSYAACFHDTATGNNYWSSSPTNYPAVTGFDLCTGWGTPKGQALMDALAGPFDPLALQSANNISVSGPVGGPLYPVVQPIAFANLGATPVSWSLINTSSWLSISSSTGLISGGTSFSVPVSIDSSFVGLTNAVFDSTLVLSNIASQRAKSVTFKVSVGQSLGQNGGFEAGNYPPWTIADDGNGYDLVHNGTTPLPGTSTSVITPHSGNYDFAFGQSGSLAYLTQTLPTTPGQAYLLSFWFSNPYAGNSQNYEQFQASWNGTNVYAVTNPPVMAWTNLIFIVTATGTNATLQFGARNDPFYFGLDDVSVMPIPNPTITGVALKGNGVTLTLNSLASLNYLLQYKTNLSQANWINLATNTAAGNILVLTNNPGGDPRRFYRIRRLP